MKNVFLSMMAAATMALAVAAPAQAATVTLGFKIRITDVFVSGKDADVGDVFIGSLSYDDSELTPGDPFTRSQSDGTLLTLSFPFLDRTVTQDGPSIPSGQPQPVDLFADFDADGSLIGLFFSVDVPNEFFLLSQGLGFSYEYSQLDDDQEQITIAAGRGKLIPANRPDVTPVPLPATAPLLLSAFLIAAVVRRRSVSRR